MERQDHLLAVCGKRADEYWRAEQFAVLLFYARQRCPAVSDV
jgi:hypothetical protein